MASGPSVFAKTNNFFVSIWLLNQMNFSFFSCKQSELFLYDTYKQCMYSRSASEANHSAENLFTRKVRMSSDGWILHYVCEVYLTIRLIKEEHAVACQVI